jgi:hypothetical protein
MMAMPVDIVPIEEIHIDGFRRRLDRVARERRYLAFLEGPRIETTRAAREISSAAAARSGPGRWWYEDPILKAFCFGDDVAPHGNLS